MVQQPSGGAYAQSGDGLLVDGTHYKVFAQVENSGSSSPSTIWYGSNLSVGVSHTYETRVHLVNSGSCFPGSIAEHVVDGTLWGSQCINWNHGNMVTTSAETDWTKTRIGFVTFSGVQDCNQLSQGSQCSANTGITVGSTDSYNCVGCTQHNPNGCYLKVATSEFEVYDDRDNPPNLDCSRH